MSNYRIAIDGPSGAGKTTMARMLAKDIGFMYVDTGAMYRAIALFMVETKKTPEQIVEVLQHIKLDVDQDNLGRQVVRLSGKEVGDRIRTQEIASAASTISALPPVREFIYQKLRYLAENYNVVMEGRDIGTVVLPDAHVKFYLTADLLVRAQRRLVEERAKNRLVDPVALATQMQERDNNDSSRALAPLSIATDAVVIDGTNLTKQEVLAMMKALVTVRVQ